MTFRSYVARRALESLPLILVVAILAFLLIHLAPGDPVQYFVSPSGSSPEYLATMRAAMGLDKPIPVQLYIYLSNLVHGNFGYSTVNEAPAINVVLGRLPGTLLLMAFSLSLAIVLGIFVGVESARRPNSKLDYLATSLSVAGYSIPVFWLGIILIIIFSVDLPWLPTTGMFTIGTTPEGIGGVIDVLRHLILPGVTLAFSLVAIVARLTRQTTIDALSENYILTARMKGLSERTIAYKHAFRNVLPPVIAVIGQSFGYFISWSVLIEIVFSWPGMGKLLWISVTSRDYPTVTTLFIVISVVTILGNLGADLINARLNPRIGYA